jgi:hypothetical protein
MQWHHPRSLNQQAFLCTRNDNTGEAWIVELMQVRAVFIDEHPASVIAQPSPPYICLLNVCARAGFNGVETKTAKKECRHTAPLCFGERRKDTEQIPLLFQWRQVASFLSRFLHEQEKYGGKGFHRLPRSPS